MSKILRDQPPDNMIYFSCQCKLAWIINKDYYNDIHYVWCSPEYDCEGNPPSANPKELYNRLTTECKYLDQRAECIAVRKIGLLRGVNAKYKEGVISRPQKNTIINLIQKRDFELFKPVIYVIDANKISKKSIKEVEVENRANATSSKEYKIERLPGKFIKIITP